MKQGSGDSVVFVYRPAPAHHGEGARRVYAPGAEDGLPTPSGFRPDHWVGDIYPVYFADGSGQIASWDAYTGTTQLPDHPESFTRGHPTRDDAARHLWAVRRAWAARLPRMNGEPCAGSR